MSYRPTNHIFLYNAYALAFGGWVRDKDKRFTPLPNIAPSVLSVAGGYGSATASYVNTGIHRPWSFGNGAPNEFAVYIGRAYTEVNGVEDDTIETPFGAYRTTVRSILDDVRINDVLYVEHSETVLMSVHEKPNRDNQAPEPKVFVGDSNMSGLRVAGRAVGLMKRDDIDRAPQYSVFKNMVKTYAQEMAVAGASGEADDPWLDDLTSWNNVQEGAPEYAQDLARIHQKQDKYIRFSIFKDVDFPTTPGARAFKQSIEVDGFGRIFFGEVYASDGTKRASMFRIDLGCDNCGGSGGSDGSTNGGSVP